MNNQVCVNCYNKKSVNQTDNRLVTESCGHVKCMNCLLHEKAGCLACKRNGSESNNTVMSKKSISEPEKVFDVPIATEVVHKDDQEDLRNFSIKKFEYSHIKVELDGNRRCYICTICKKKFYARSQVCYHAYCNGDKKPHFCQICKQGFASLSHYKYHMRVHNQDKSYVCDICGAGFYQLSQLKRHKLKHTKEKNFPCSECTKAFNNLSSLRKHMRIHTQERPYTCSTCGRRFRDGSNYKKHVDKHKRLGGSCGNESRAVAEHGCRGASGGGGGSGSGSGSGSGGGGGGFGGGPRDHACPRCRKAFHSRKDMRRHAAIHSDSKPFRCKACPEERRFRRKDNLERHIRNAHPDCEPEAASECDLGVLQSVTRHAFADHDELHDHREKIRLEKLNPLTPLPEEVILKLIEVAKTPEIIKPKEATAEVSPGPKVVNSDSVVDKKSIIEANNARESVIVEKRNAESDKKVSSPENEYVHKIRKAIVPLPPIDQEKFRSVQRGLLPDCVTAAPIKNVEIYKKILYEKVEKDTTEVIQNPKMHWRRKMEQNIN